jgi:hypothetical protein
MGIVAAFILVILLTVALIPFVTVQWKGMITVTAVIIVTVLSSIIAVKALSVKMLNICSVAR